MRVEAVGEAFIRSLNNFIIFFARAQKISIFANSNDFLLLKCI